MTIYNGWTRELSREEREANRARAIVEIEAARLEIIAEQEAGDPAPAHSWLAEYTALIKREEVSQ